MQAASQTPPPPPQAAAPREVLVVDDSRAQRMVLALALQRDGYRVTQAASGEEALALCTTTPFDFIISDWVMPGMDGLEFVRQFRRLPRYGYAYVVLLTSKSEKAEVADGLDTGADEFLSKPVSTGELRARLRAGERIIGMQAELLAKNRLVGDTLAELQALYESLDRDLLEARKLQQTLVRDRDRRFAGGRASLMIRSSGHVGGDLAGFFEINPRRLALYSVDVSGHGVASAMMTARLAGMLSGAAPEQNIALTIGAYGQRDAWPPEMVAYRFNRLMIEDFQVDQYFTMAYAEIDLDTGRVKLVQAGHPHPAILRASGRVEFLGRGGLPIGLIAGAAYERTEARLFPGDRLFLVSDGLTECPDPGGQELGESGLRGMLGGLAGLDNPQLMEALMWNLAVHHGSEDFPDDVSGAMFHFTGDG